ncbi:MAG TPA: hypothetical protein VGK74_09160 [Symbiobacteriaceae bacterium]
MTVMPGVLIALKWLLILVGWILALVLLLVMALLFLPLDLSGRTDSDLHADEWGEELEGAVRWQLRLRWGWGLFLVGLAGRWLTVEQAEVRLMGIRLRSRKRPQPVKAKTEKPAPAKRRRMTPDLTKALIQEGLRLLDRVWRDLGLQVEGEVAYGLDDPALVGWCEALLWTAGRPAAVRVTPDWLDPRLEGWLQFRGRIFGVEFLAALLAALKNPVLRRHLVSGFRAKLFGRKTKFRRSLT